MAENPNALVVKTVTGRLLDHGGSANLGTFDVMPESVLPPLVRPRGKTMIWANGSAGQSLIGAADTGLDGDLDIPLVFQAKDPNNTGEVTLAQTLRGLYDNNITTLTGYGSVNVVSELVNGGPQEAELELTIRDNEGGSNILTVSVILTAVETQNLNGILAWAPTFRVTSALVWS